MKHSKYFGSNECMLTCPACEAQYQKVLDDAKRFNEEHARYKAALESISKNSCCGSCQEAKLVAKKALKDEE